MTLTRIRDARDTNITVAATMAAQLTTTNTRYLHQLSYPRPSRGRSNSSLLMTVILLLNLSLFTCNFVLASPSSPPQWRTLGCAASVVSAESRSLMIFGGTSSHSDITDPISMAADSDSNSTLSDVEIFDMENHKWRTLSASNPPAHGQQLLPGCVNVGDNQVVVYAPNYGNADMIGAQVFRLDTTLSTWEEMASAPPTSVFGAAFALVDDGHRKLVYMHGGIPLDPQTNTASSSMDIDNSLHVLDPSSMNWMTASNGPARKYHSMCYLASINSLVIFGGADQNVKSYNDIKIYNLDSSSWDYTPNIDASTDGQPSARVLHSSVCTQNKVIIFGGAPSVDDNPVDSSVWILTANSQRNFTWSKAPVKEKNRSSGPSSRLSHIAILSDDGVMYVYGGTTATKSEQDRDMYALDTQPWTWSKWSAKEATNQKHPKRSTVIIAATVSSVLGFVIICILIFVAYRLYQKRHPKPLPHKASTNGNDTDPQKEKQESSFFGSSQMSREANNNLEVPTHGQQSRPQTNYSNIHALPFENELNSETYEFDSYGLPLPAPAYAAMTRENTTDSSISMPYGSSFAARITDSQSLSEAAARESHWSGSSPPNSPPRPTARIPLQTDDINEDTEISDIRLRINTQLPAKADSKSGNGSEANVRAARRERSSSILSTPSIETLTRPASPPVPPNMQLIYRYLAHDSGGIPLSELGNQPITSADQPPNSAYYSNTNPSSTRHSTSIDTPKHIMSPLDRMAQYHIPESSLEIPQTCINNNNNDNIRRDVDGDDDDDDDDDEHQALSVNRNNIPSSTDLRNR